MSHISVQNHRERNVTGDPLGQNVDRARTSSIFAKTDVRHGSAGQIGELLIGRIIAKDCNVY